jgi:formylglycine-generating enzyme required for sulfatase activity
MVLFELLTDQLPYDVSSTILPRALQVICEHPPRRLSAVRRALRGDLETIVLKALDKEPARRYAGAGELGRDVQRLLAHQPIEARRDSTLYVLRKYAVRNRRPLVLLAATAVLFVAIGLTILGLWNRKQERERTTAIAETFSEARRLIDEAHILRFSFNEIDYQLSAFTSQLCAEYYPPEKDRRMFAIEDEVCSLRWRLSENVQTILELLNQAEKLGADTDQVAHFRGKVYLEEYSSAWTQNDTVRIAELRNRILENDPTGQWKAALVLGGSVSLTTEPPGAVCHVFRSVLQSEVISGGEPRVVPVPLGGPELPVPPGTWTLRVEQGMDPVETGDLITQVAGYSIGDSSPAAEGGTQVPRLDRLAEQGNVPAEVWHDGRLTTLILPPGLRVRRTSRPLFAGPGSLVGVTPVNGLALERSTYVFLFRKMDFEDLIVSYTPSDAPLRFTLNPLGTTPPGFRFVPTNNQRPHHDRFWIMETEVTAGQYLEFLNSPEAAARIAGSSVPILFPRSNENAASGGHFPRDASGRFLLPDSWQSDWPVCGVSWHDAKAYADWRTAKAQAAGLHHVYALPTLGEWAEACAGHEMHLRFVYGARFRPKWQSSCFARPKPHVEPVLSFPNDESVYGVFDLAGSISEWQDDWWLEDRGLRRFGGGSWADGGPEDLFTAYGGGGKLPEQVSDSIGFRLVLRTPGLPQSSPP